MTQFRPKDYVYVDGFYAAVVSTEIEDERVLTTVRYFQDELGDVVKFNTLEANEFLEKHKPEFIFHSKKFDVELHAIPTKSIENVFLPNEAYLFLKTLPLRDIKQNQTIDIIEFFVNSGLEPLSIGVTGSVLIGFQTDNSDIDLVVYGRDNFFKARDLIKQGLENDFIQDLDHAAWVDSYDRRDSALSFDEYVFHEKRKFNKFLYQGTKVDLSLVLNEEETVLEESSFIKLSKVVLQARVIDDSKSFDLPARYFIDNPEFTEVVCYTATYTGQAKQGELIEISGVIEINVTDEKRILVGTSREAENEYIKVIDYE